MKPKLLWVGDAGCPSGFARATHGILETLRHHYEVSVLGLNYRGDPHPYDKLPEDPYNLWAAAPGGDSFGVGRLIWMCDRDKPDVIVLQNDGWNIPLYMQQLRFRKSNGEYAWPQYAEIPVVAIVAIDGKNFRGRWLDGVAHAIFWTQFALDEAREGGYQGSAEVIPLGVDLTTFYPGDKMEARKRRLPEPLQDAFIIGNVNRNQPRKRWDLMVKYFAEWINSTGIRDAWLYLHTAPTGDTGCNVRQLAAYYGVVDRIAEFVPEVFYGVDEPTLVDTYNFFDVNASTTQGEGFGLTTIEAMACGIPCLAPDWSALGDWAKGAAWLVPCPTTHIGPPYENVIGGIADEHAFVMALNRLYQDEGVRKQNGRAALERAEEPRFRWEAIGQAYVQALATALNRSQANVNQPGATSPFTRKVVAPTVNSTVEVPV